MTTLLFNCLRNAHNSAKQFLFIFSAFIGLLLLSFQANAVATITRATGGTLISADKAENASAPSYTTLGNVVITEGTMNDIAIGTNVTFTLIAPSGWKFNPSASVFASTNLSTDITSLSVTSITASLITIQATIASVLNSDILTISGVEVRAIEGGNIPNTANITRGGSAMIIGCSAGAVLANLSQTAGNIDQLVITLPGQTYSDANIASTSGNSGSPTAQTSGTAFTITKIRACDQFYNVVTNYFGVKSLSYSGPQNGFTTPTYTTSVSFASGVSSTVLNTNLKFAETTAINLTDGTYFGSSALVTVNAGTYSKFIVEASTGGNIGTHITDIPFDIKITATDANNNPCTTGGNTFTGTVDITSSGTLSTGSGTTASFTSGVLSSRTIAYSSPGNYTITATKTGGSEFGTSNSFQVNYPAATLTSISPSCITPGGSSFTITVNGNNFTGSSVVRINGVDRTTTFVNINRLTATILASDISTPNIYAITANTPGTGSTAPLILNMNRSSTASISICQGSSYQLPDGIFENSAGTYVSTIPTVAGCDSTITTNLTVTPNLMRSESISICPGTSYTLPDGSTQNSPGTYYSTIVNQSGCDSLITTNLSVYSAPILIATPSQIYCYGLKGSVVLNAFSGTFPYTYGPEATTNLDAGSYSFSVTDANGCSANTTATIDPAPSQLIVTATPTQINCFGETGSMSLLVSGGTPSYSFDSTPTTNLTAGSYTYLVSDNNGCTATTTGVINTAPAAINATASVVNTPCGVSSGSASVSVTGGSSPYTYSWNTIPARTTSTISGLPTGTYTVSITDSRGCIFSKSATISNTNPLQVNITGGVGICPGSSASLCASGNFASYSWSTGETTQCITTNVVDTIVVTATDISGCIGTKSVVTRNSTLPNCTITGGSLCPNSVLVLRAPLGYPYYRWGGGGTTSTFTARNAGTYSVTVKNSDGCASTCSYTVNSPLRTTSTKADAKCANEFKGNATVTASAGILPYTYLWSNGETTPMASGLPAGTYNVRVTDGGGCVKVVSTTINSNKTTYDYSAISTNFNSTAISPGTSIWFSAVVNITYTGTYPVTIGFNSQNINTTGLNIIPANAKLIITNSVSQASTSFIGGEWVTIAPPNLTGNYFIAGCSYQSTSGFLPNLTNVKWRGIWTSSSSCVTNLQWKWSAAAYSSLPTDHTLINVQPTDDPSASPYFNGDLAGTPENFKFNCIAGALSVGVPDFVGTYTSPLNRVPCSTQTLCNALRPASPFSSEFAGSHSIEHGPSHIVVNAYPNPFSLKTRIEFEKLNESGHVSIELYTLYGEKLKVLFDDNVDAETQYSLDFDAGELASGVYIYKVVCDDEIVMGKMYLQR